ncbi:MAG: hypothetical protein K9L98_02275 [Candidatus Pacebacteria bacterium]|nr:hypothetical protein [Candidatus Paceibacterota bacterium]MCF7862812.1 hypothetical protein [Candidatus Paceibacterota bacterium]
MNNINKWYLYVVVLLVVATAVYFFVFNKKDSIDDTSMSKTIQMCYRYEEKTSSGFYDKAWLKMDITEEKVVGEYRNLPAQKDSKIGKFEGTVGAMNPNTSSRTADVMWEALAEGILNKEQLKINFGEGSAVAMFGVMSDKGDGTYVYKDPTNLSASFQMSQIDCVYLDDYIFVEKYIRENINSIVEEAPVLGGSWYPTRIYINPFAQSGTISYEDGHIQGEMDFYYIRDGENVEINKLDLSK